MNTTYIYIAIGIAYVAFWIWCLTSAEKVPDDFNDRPDQFVCKEDEKPEPLDFTGLI